jgi:hypothetical protein
MRHVAVLFYILKQSVPLKYCFIVQGFSRTLNSLIINEAIKETINIEMLFHVITLQVI